MAKRPVFQVSEAKTHCRRVEVDFVYNAGFAVVQKQKNIAAIHSAYNARYPEHRVLEISSKSLQPIGVELSAFNLMLFVPSLGKSIPVENAYQGSKKFALAGPFTDLYLTTPKAAKKDERLISSGRITAYEYEGREYPLRPANAFYDWLYINALSQSQKLAAAITEYDAFTDIEFNPEKSLNCQARAAAVYVSLARKGLLDGIADFDFFLRLMGQ